MASAYVEETAMADWKSQMDRINNECIDEIGRIESAVAKLPDSFKGDYAEKYDEAFGNYSNAVKASHEAMKQFDQFLDTIVAVMKS